jgi:hypothetical protein
MLDCKLVEAAVDQLRILRKDPRYKIDMQLLHCQEEVCSVCLAGAYLVSSGVLPGHCDGLDRDGDEKYWALDFLRKGWTSKINEMFGTNIAAMGNLTDMLEGNDQDFENACTILMLVQGAIDVQTHHHSKRD